MSATLSFTEEACEALDDYLDRMKEWQVQVTFRDGTKQDVRILGSAANDVPQRFSTAWVINLNDRCEEIGEKYILDLYEGMQTTQDPPTLRVAKSLLIY